MPIAKNSSPGSNSGTASAAEALEGIPKSLLNVREAVRAKVFYALALCVAVGNRRKVGRKQECPSVPVCFLNTQE